jgi:hypothetical protein
VRPPDRLVICALGGERSLLELPSSTLTRDREIISGGERSLYELAVAASVLGMEVELRGALNPDILAELCSAVGARPSTGLTPRRPSRHDLVVLPEAADVPLIAAVQLSGARRVMHMLAPPGLWGWSFLPEWTGGADGNVVDLRSVGLPATFRAMADLGFSLWTNARGIAEAGMNAGVSVEWVGTGTPVEFPDMPEKRFDVAVVEANRWYGEAQAIVDQMPGASILRVGPLPNTYSLSAALGPARVLVWPSRIEGMSRIAREARAVGTIPVALDTNPFVTPADHGEGVVLAADTHGIAERAQLLLGDDDRLKAAAAAAVASARQQAAWQPYVRRVKHAVESAADRPSAFSLGYFGDLVEGHDLRRSREIDELQSALADQRRSFEEAKGHLERVQAAHDAVKGALAAAQSQLTAYDGALAATQLELATCHEALAARRLELEASREELEASREELGAYRRRLAVRVLERSGLGRVWRSVRPRGVAETGVVP